MDNFVAAQTRMVSSEVIQLLTETFIFIPNWKWIVLVVASILSLPLRSFIQYTLKKIKKSSSWLEHKNFWSFLLKLEIEGPLSWILLGMIWLFIIDNLQLTAGMDKYLTLLTKVILSFHIIRFLYISVDAFGDVLNVITAKTETTMDDQLAPFVTKTLKVFVVVLGGLIVLQNFGVNVMSLLAGLGLGGLALALAAQDTAANLFGSITILFDSPFKLGDWIKIGDTEGTVEEIGFRSTRIRTFYNSLITIPNSTVAKEKIDNMGVRPRRRIRQTLGLHYDTPPSAIEQFCQNVKYLIQQETKVDRESIIVSFTNFGASTLDVLVNFHLVDIQTGEEELQRQQKIFCDIISLAKQMHIEFAYPTQTVYYQTTSLAPAEK